MKMKLLGITSIIVMMLGFIGTARAEDVTITGKASCEKGHKTVIKVQEGDRTVAYHLDQNAVSKQFHKQICQKASKVTAVGEVKREDGQLHLVAKRIELAKK